MPYKTNLHSVPGPNRLALPNLLRATVSLAMCLTRLASPYHVEPGLYKPLCSSPASQATFFKACLMLLKLKLVL